MLIKIQPDFKSDLVDSVQAFIIDVGTYSREYEQVRHANFLTLLRFFLYFLVGAFMFPWCVKNFGVPFPLKVGPMVSGVAPNEASDRLVIFQV